MSGRDSSTAKQDVCADVDALEKRYRDLAKQGKSTHPLASENLEYWLSAKGGTKTIAASYFSSDKAVLKQLKVHRSIFLSEKDGKKGVAPRIKKDGKPKKEYSMTWEDSLYATVMSDLFFALGGFTLISDVKVKVLDLGKDSAKVSFTSWKCSIKDIYNWDKGKSVYVPGYGQIDDEDALCLEKAGRAKSYDIKSEDWEVKDRDLVADATVDLS